MKNREKQSHNEGFTLVEMVVSFVLILMLASLSVAGILAYQDFADFKRQNDYAQTLFSAAQTKLTGYSVRGQLEGLEEASAELLDLSQITTPKGVKASESEDGQAAKSGDIYYLVGNRDSYEKYQAGEFADRTDAESMAYQALYQIFDEFLMDKSILSGCIAIEFNPSQGLVYSVLYSDKCSAFTYNDKNKNGIVNILDRQDDYRSEYMIGYYGLD